MSVRPDKHQGLQPDQLLIGSHNHYFWTHQRCFSRLQAGNPTARVQKYMQAVCMIFARSCKCRWRGWKSNSSCMCTIFIPNWVCGPGFDLEAEPPEVQKYPEAEKIKKLSWTLEWESWSWCYQLSFTAHNTASLLQSAIDTDLITGSPHFNRVRHSWSIT